MLVKIMRMIVKITILIRRNDRERMRENKTVISQLQHIS